MTDNTENQQGITGQEQGSDGPQISERLVEMFQQQTGLPRDAVVAELQAQQAKYNAMSPEEKEKTEAQARAQFMQMQQQQELQARMANPIAFLGGAIIGNLTTLENIFNQKSALVETLNADNADEATRTKAANELVRLERADTAGIERMVTLETAALSAITEARKQMLTENDRAEEAQKRTAAAAYKPGGYA
jgi:hypothetical protein